MEHRKRKGQQTYPKVLSKINHGARGSKKSSQIHKILVTYGKTSSNLTYVQFGAPEKTGAGKWQKISINGWIYSNF